jgi:alpha/beta superfamily hydrolase
MSEVMISGPEGRLQGMYRFGGNRQGPIALILHPHPQHGGTMNNKATYTLFRAFNEMGFTVLRFNFRGVGKSEGHFSQGEGELSDAASCLNWLQAQHPDPSACWVAGFSFGAWIAMQLLMRRPEITSFVSVSPPANLYDFSFLAPCPVPGVVIQGTEDTIVTKDSVVRLTNRLSLQKGIAVTLKMVQNADHFFKDQLEVLSDYTKQYVLHGR